MDKRFYNKVAIGTYATIFLSASSFIAQYIFSGWDKLGVKPMMMPLGYFSIFLAVVAASLFVWNIFRHELTHGQYIHRKNERLPFLDNLEKLIQDYMKKTDDIVLEPSLYDIKKYTREFGLPEERKIDVPIGLILFGKILVNNIFYKRLKDNKDLDVIRTEIADTLSKIHDNRLNKLLDELYRREHIERSYNIALTLYKDNLKPDRSLENLILNAKAKCLIEIYLKQVYERINLLKRGDDLE